MKTRKHVFLIVLGALLMFVGGILIAQVDEGLQYILPAPEEAKELEALYEDGQKQLEGMADTLSDYAIGARLQGANLSREGGESMQTAVYAVGEGYFDTMHETLLAGRYVSRTDIQKGADVIVLDERAALLLFPGDDPIEKKVTLNGETYEVAGVIKGGRRLGEQDEHVVYIPITTASRRGVNMQTVEMNAHGINPTGSAILMEDTLSSWKRGGSFYRYDKLAMGAWMPARWAVLFAGIAVLLALLRRVNSAAWKRICYYTDQLKTRYARDMLPGMVGSVLMCAAGYIGLLTAAFLLAKFSIAPLYVFTEWVPEVVVEFSALASRFWSLNDMNAASVRYASRFLCQMELGQGLLRWGMMAVLLGLVLRANKWLNDRPEKQELPTER